MGKQRMTALDVRASVEEMRSSLLGLRLLNIYDIAAKMFLFRFGHGERKRTVLVENGVRMHITELAREKPKVPSQFTLKLRKHVRAWRLSRVTQLQHDRTIDLCFGTFGSEGCFHIIVELFSKGNVILTDYAYSIMMLLRTHRDDDVKFMVRAMYPVTNPFEEGSSATGAAFDADGTVQRAAGATGEEEEHSDGAAATRPAAVVDTVTTSAISAESVAATEPREKRLESLREDLQVVLSRHQHDSEISLKSILSAVRHFGPGLAEHILATAGIKNYKLGELPMSVEALFEQLQHAMLEAAELAHAPLPTGGYLITWRSEEPKRKRNGGTETAATVEARPEDVSATAATGAPLVAVRYDDLSPVLLAQYRAEGVTASYLPSYGKVCDAYFLYTEAERIDQHNEKKATTVLSKRERFERDHARRISGLEREGGLNRTKGEMIILNAEKIDAAIDLINGALASGIQWDALKQLLKRRHAEGHPVAYMINELSLERNSMSVLVERELFDDEDDGDVESMAIEVSLAKTAYANATDYFSKKKHNEMKLTKTKAATERAAAGAARKGERVAASQPIKKLIVVERQREWWERFLWFITSAGDVVLRGRDTQTTEVLMRRLMRVGDLIVMCEVDGALPCLLRPMHALWSGDGSLTDGRQPVPRLSLEEAGAWCVSLSHAWEQKQSIGSWWAYASQLAGGTAAGCYDVVGEKHHIGPQPLTLGCGLLCRVTRTVLPPEASRIVPEEEEAPGAAAHELLPLPWPHILREMHALVAGHDYFPPDAALGLQELPSVESLRARRSAACAPSHVRSRQQPHMVASENRENMGRAKVAAPRDPITAATARPPLRPQQLSMHQKKKLKKIRERYGDQDDEDRARGAALNGNVLASVQQAELARLAEAATRRQQTEKAAAKQVRAKERADGKLRYRAVAGHTGDTTDYSAEATTPTVPPGDSLDVGSEEEEEVEVVSEFSDDDSAINASATGKAAGSHDVGEDEDVSGATPASDAEAAAATEDATSATVVADDRSGPSRAAPATNADTAAYASAQDALLKTALPYYTAHPQPTDVVQHVICVCAPFHVLMHYTYRVELGFGNVKKGHSARALLQAFQDRAAYTGGVADGYKLRAKKNSEWMRREASAGSGSGTPMSAANETAGTNPTLQTLLRAMDIGECMEQLRGNVRPVNIRMK